MSPKNLTCFYTYSASCKVMKPFCLHLGQWAIYLCFSQCCTTTIKHHINIEDCSTCETVLEEGSMNSLPCHQRTSHAFTHTVHRAKSWSPSAYIWGSGWFTFASHNVAPLLSSTTSRYDIDWYRSVTKAKPMKDPKTQWIHVAEQAMVEISSPGHHFPAVFP